MASSNLIPEGSNGTIPVDEAAEQTANWRAYLSSREGQGLITKAFLVPIENFQNMIANNPDAEGIRVYLALKKAGDPTSMTALLVPVTSGSDVVKMPANDNGTILGDPGDDDGSNVYNFTSPCPPLCDVDGPLNG